jgi:MFS family permease
MIDYNAPNTYHNWVDPNKLGLTCLNPLIIGLQGTAYFIGYGVSSLIVPRLSDKYYARRKPYLYSMIGCLICYTIAYLSHSIYIIIFCFFCIGLCAGGRVCVGIAYMNEFMPNKYQNIATSFRNLGDTAVMFYQSIMYFFFPNWVIVHSVVYIISLITVILTF